MNFRALLHAVSAACLAVAGGTVVLAGLPDVWMHNIVAGATMIGIVSETYLASTSTGKNAAAQPRTPMGG